MGSVSSKLKKVQKQKDYVSWFEIPAVNFLQAVKFYNQIFEINMEIFNGAEHTMAFFPSTGGIGGAIVCGPGSIPHENGTLIYLNGGDNLDSVLQKVEDAGGRIITPKTAINEEAGYFAIFFDSEGNKLALHSKK